MRPTIILTVIVFTALMVFGLCRAGQKPLWNDELYSLVSSTSGTSYQEMIRGGIEEGNNSPLFYFLQKLQCDLLAYRPLDAWVQGKWDVTDAYSQLFLRVQPVLFMALALSALFYFFSRRYSLTAGLYALAVALSSFMVWAHWIEARPYALWFMLSIFQMLVLVDALKAGKRPDGGRYHTWLAAIHMLLALTTTISVVQIAAAALVFWLYVDRRWKSYFLLFALPFFICLFYYMAAPKYPFFFVDGPLALINASFPKDRIFVFVVCACMLLWSRFCKKELHPAEQGFLAFAGLMMAFFVMILLKLKLGEAPNKGFQVSARYFMSLAPLAIVGTTFLSIWMMGFFKNAWMRWGVAAFLALLLTLRVKQLLLFNVLT